MWGSKCCALVLLGVLGTAAAAGCGSGTADSGESSPGASVTLKPAKDETFDALTSQLSSASSLSADALREKHALPAGSELGYDPSTAAGLELIQASKLALDDEEQRLLRDNGFVVSGRRNFPSMLAAYADLYAEDLPLYVSADSLLNAVHLSYDTLLASLETSSLIPGLTQLLDDMRAALPAHASEPGSADADLFLAIAKSLLAGKNAAPVAGAKALDVETIVAAAQSGKGASAVTLFGTKRDLDFSQFTPRGHYTDSPALTQYFRAMMWLGRTDLRLIETRPDGSQVFQRRQFDTMLLLRALVSKSGLSQWQQIDQTLQAFVGESDYMRLTQVDALLEDLGVDARATSGLSDRQIAQTILDKGYGAQRIASQLIVNATADGHTLPLDRSFALFGQRYVLDSHVFSNVVYDRVKDRLMPKPLDVAFAALGNDAALPLLRSELDSYAYAGALEQTRVLADAHGDTYWNSNLYTTWLRALRALSPRASELMDPGAAGLPKLTSTDAWQRRILSTQLASWAELRHDTILYAKQSYTGSPVCEYPDAYVDPYPDVFAALAEHAQRGLQLLEDLNAGSATPASQAPIKAYFTHLQNVATTLGQMAEAQRAGQPFSGEQLAFINEAVHAYDQRGCAPLPRVYDGWFAKLHFNVGSDGRVISEFKGTIADVHTQPADASGNPVGRVLHVGTGKVRLMVVTVDTCRGPRAYAGPASSYYEVTTKDWKRINDLEWRDLFKSENPQEPDWTGAFVRAPL